MESKKYKLRLSERFTLKSAVLVGVILLIFVVSFAGHREITSTTEAAQAAMGTMKQQCLSFNKLTVADRTKSLFRLSDLMRDLSVHMEHNPNFANDIYLEQYVDSLRLSGVAVLDNNLVLDASGYTRRFQGADWSNSSSRNHFADIVNHPSKIYIERVFLEGEYYDVCAVARRDKPGVIIGFYHQPSGLITDTEKDLENMLTGLHLERGGHYAIAEEGEVRATSDKSLLEVNVSESDILQQLSSLPKDDKMHSFSSNGMSYWGMRSGCEGYSLYIYYPSLSLVSTWLFSAAVFASVYSIILLLFIAFRNRSLHKKQEELQKSNHDLAQTVEMLKALETIYFTLFYVDLKNDTYKTIYISPWLESSILQSGVYTELKQLFLDSMIVPSYCDEIDRRMSIEFIEENLNKERITDVRKSFYTDYQAIRGSLIKWCRVSATAVDYREDGKPYHILALLQDIDEEKAREAEYQEQILKEAHDAKVANNAKSEFLRRISHDICTPLNGIHGYLELGSRHPENLELQQHCRENAAAALHTLLDLVNSVLDMSKLESSEIILEHEPFDLGEILHNINAIMEPSALEKDIQYDVLYGDSIAFPHVIGSPRHLSQIIMNMTSNAIKYSNSGGHIYLDLKLIDKTDDEVSYEFICKDNGIGMSKEFQRHMYEPFVQEAVGGARTTYEGVGLGLSIMKKLIDAMGGTVICESEKGVGTTFHVFMTFEINKTYHAPETKAESFGETVLKNKNILLVEDNDLNMEIAETMLVEFGAQVDKAWNGREAVQKFEASKIDFYDLIFMDIMMPEMNGFEAVRAIRSMDRSDADTVLISAMSANAFQDDIQKSLDSGMNAHISKPVDVQKFLSVVVALLSDKE